MDRRIEDTGLGNEVLAAMKESAEEELLTEMRLHLSRGKWFLKGASAIISRTPMYYDKTEAWWIWNHTTCCWEEQDETEILNACRRTLSLLGDTSISHGNKLLSAIKQVSRERTPKEPPLNLIQFGRNFTNIDTGETIESTPLHFSTNTIPWNIGPTDKTPIMDKLISSWVGEECVQTMYELIAYCTYRDYPIHRIFCFVGSGANGKTRLIKLIEKFIGEKNKSSVTLKKIGNNDFALYPLYRKLTCFVGETTHHRMESTELLKALSGQDPVSFEAKGRNSFTGTNYAKIIIGTNVLPPSSDTSRGWFRRWFVIQFPNEFTEEEDVLNRIPEQEYENLAKKCVKILPALLKRGGFTNEGSIDERQRKYVESSSPIKQFLTTEYEKDHSTYIAYTDCYQNFLGFLERKRLRRISRKEFSNLLDDEGLDVRRINKRDEFNGETTTFHAIYGLRKTQNNTDNTNNTDVPVNPQIPISSFGSNPNIGIIEHIDTWEPINVVQDDFISKISMLENIRGMVSATREDLQKLFPVETKVLEGWINELLHDGDIFEIKPGIFRVL